MSDYPEVGTLLRQADAQVEAGAFDAADAIYRRILDFDPAHMDATRRRIMVARRTGRRDDVLPLIEAAIRLAPANPHWLIGRALALGELGRYEEALASYDRAIELKDDLADAWFGKAQLLLQLGRYKEGWELFEWRFYFSGSSGDVRLFRQPQWDGGGFHGQTLLLHAEQGLGDTIQFYRFVRPVRRFGGVAVEVAPSLARLLAAQPGAPMIIPRGQPLPSFDLQCPMMSLPMLLGTDLNSIPGVPYLTADPMLSHEWTKRLPPRDGRPRIGINWAGNQANVEMLNRTIPLAGLLDMLRPLGDRAVIISLQKDVPAADLPILAQATHVIDMGTGQTDMADAAAIIGQLDLVISVDTSLAHLAGATGGKLFVLLPFVTDWRWLIGRDDTPWYPSARLFRQAAPDDWHSVVPAVQDALRAFG